MTWQLWSVLPVWLLTLVAVVIVGVASSADERITWIGISLAGAVIATFAIQLSSGRPDGFVNRAMASIGVSVLILAAATGVFALLG
jgi:hypothetical protein